MIPSTEKIIGSCHLVCWFSFPAHLFRPSVETSGTIALLSSGAAFSFSSDVGILLDSGPARWSSVCGEGARRLVCWVRAGAVLATGAVTVLGRAGSLIRRIRARTLSSS